VIFTGASAIFRVDQRVVTNRKAEAALLAAGWRFATGSDPYAAKPSAATFPLFLTTIQDLLATYNTEYVTDVDQPAANDKNTAS
jgi:hypothetical protein